MEVHPLSQRARDSTIPERNGRPSCAAAVMRMTACTELRGPRPHELDRCRPRACKTRPKEEEGKCWHLAVLLKHILKELPGCTRSFFEIKKWDHGSSVSASGRSLRVMVRSSAFLQNSLLFGRETIEEDLPERNVKLKCQRAVILEEMALRDGICAFEP